MKSKSILLFALFISAINLSPTVECFAQAQSAKAPELRQRGFFDILLPRKPIPYKKLALNAFANEARFGTVRSQLSEVKSRLGIKYIRILFAWNNDVQPSEASAINYSFYDDIARSIPSGVKALVVLTGLPSWARSGDNPSDAFINAWVTPTVNRYKSNSRIAAFQIWNEPNDPSNIDNAVLGFENPQNYINMLSNSRDFIKSVAPKKLVLNAATTAITQNYPDTLNYNQALIDAGIESLVDRFAIHYYGDSHYNVLLPGGVKDLLSNLSKPVWVTEIGKQGASKQREYLERTCALLDKQIPLIEKYFYYQFTEGTAANVSYGLKNAGGVSGLYKQIVVLKNS